MMTIIIATILKNVHFNGSRKGNMRKRGFSITTKMIYPTIISTILANIAPFSIHLYPGCDVIILLPPKINDIKYIL